MEQGSFEWFVERYRRVTMSDGINTLMTGGAVAKNSLLRKIRERRTHGQERLEEEYLKAEITSATVGSLAHGKRFEDVAIANYELTRFTDVRRVGFRVHPKWDWCGGSADFVEGDSSFLKVGEVKNPSVSANHLAILKYRQYPAEYHNQLQGNIDCWQAHAGVFISYDDRQPLESNKLCVIHVPLDEDWAARFAALAAEFDQHLRDGSFFEQPMTKASDGLPRMF